MAEPIEIIIRKGTGGDGSGFGVSGNTPKEHSQKDTTSPYLTLAKRSGIALGGFAVATAKRAINYSISQYGNITGDYITQAEMQMNMQIFNDVMGIGAGAISGAAMGSVVPGIGTAVGAVIGAGIATANVAMNYGFQYRTLQTNIAKLDTYANIMRERSGNVYNNDSRGTNR